MSYDKIVKLPNYGRLIVVTDLHGNLNDYKRYLKLWDRDDENCHIVFAGDLIHSMDDNDGSVEIVEDAMFKSAEYSNYHCLLGNHEWCHILTKDIFKAGENLRVNFETLVSHKKGYVEPSLTGYIRYFKTMPYFLKTSNGIFISHTGSSDRIQTMEDFNQMCADNQLSDSLYGFLWNRYASRLNGYTIDDIDKFLNIIGCKLMIVGHSIVDSGYKIIGRQMVLSSSFYTKVKSYLDIDLSKEYNTMDNLIEDVKVLN